MSWLKTSIWSSIRYKRSNIYGFFSNEIRTNQAQYFSSLSNRHKVQLSACRCNGVERNFSVVEAAKSVQPAFYIFFKQLSKNWFAYVPYFGSIKYRHQGFWWFKTLDELDVPEFIRLFEMDDTFYSRFSIIELHVWMLLFHLPKECKIDSLVYEGVIEAMWIDAEARGRMIDKLNPYFKKDFARLNNKFKVSLVLYDEGYLKSDALLSSALWYNFFDRKNVDPRVLEALVEYIRHQMHKLNQLNYEELRVNENKSQIWSSPKPYIKHLKQ